jgi:hypothetical protein
VPKPELEVSGISALTGSMDPSLLPLILSYRAAVPERRQSDKGEVAATGIRCPKCNACVTSREWKFCPHCGAKLPAPPKPGE